MLLTQAGGPLPEVVSAFLGAAFSADAPWCSVDDAATGCLGPGFGVVIGGVGSVTAAAVGALTDLVSGGHPGDGGDGRPSVGTLFPTGLDLRPVYANVGTASGAELCVGSGALQDVRWLSVTADDLPRHFVTEIDALRAGTYVASTGTSRASCFALPDAPADLVITGVSLSGHATDPVVLHLAPATRLTLSGPIQAAGQRSEGRSGLHLTAISEAGPLIERSNRAQPVQGTTLDLDLQPDGTGTRGVFSGSYTIRTSLGSVTGTVEGEFLLVDGQWELRGRSRSGPFTEGDVVGGFRGTAAAAGALPGVEWSIDGFPER